MIQHTMQHTAASTTAIAIPTNIHGDTGLLSFPSDNGDSGLFSFPSGILNLNMVIVIHAVKKIKK